MGNGPGSSEHHSKTPSREHTHEAASHSDKGEEMEPQTPAELDVVRKNNICTNQIASHSDITTSSHSIEDNKHANSNEIDKHSKGISLCIKRERNILNKTASVDQVEVNAVEKYMSNDNITETSEHKTKDIAIEDPNDINSQNSFNCKDCNSCSVSCTKKVLQQGKSISEKIEKSHIAARCTKPIESFMKQDKDVSEVQKTLKETISKLKTGGDWCQFLGQISKTMRSCTSPEETMKALIEGNFLEKFEEFLELHHINSFESLKASEQMTEKVWPVVKRFLIILWITCDRSVNFCQYFLSSKVFLFLLSELRVLASVNYEQNEVFLFIIKSVLGILHNISRHVPNSKWNLRNEGLVTILRTFLPSDIPMVRLKSLIVLSYLLSEAENEIINSDDDNFVFVFNVLADALISQDHKSSKYGMNASEVLRGISNLAINDENKIRIVRNGGLPLYQEVLKSGFPDEIKITIMTLWSLAFHHYNKKKMREMPGIMGKLYELRQCDDEEICHAARGTFWELENTSKSAIGKNFSSSAEKDPTQPHIMISYQWDSQPIMLKVKDRLKHAGYKVWMDVEHMSGSTLEAMALAVEKAAVVLICMSEKYKNSPNCRTEAEYVYRLRKDFVPLRLQQEYVPDGWLGILVGTRLYFDMHMEDTLDTQLPKLLKELRERGKISPSEDIVDQGIPPRRLTSRESLPVLHQPEGREVIEWTYQDVAEWLDKSGLADTQNHFEEIDGQMLLELQRIQKSAPEFFYTLLKTDFKFSTVMIIKFSKALRGLR